MRFFAEFILRHYKILRYAQNDAAEGPRMTLRVRSPRPCPHNDIRRRYGAVIIISSPIFGKPRSILLRFASYIFCHLLESP